MSGDMIVEEEPIVEKKDISVFISKLWERLQWVFKEIISFSIEDYNLESSYDSEGFEIETLVDVPSHIYSAEISRLAEIWVIDSGRAKFYPDNYLRRYEFVIMLVKYRLATSKQQVPLITLPTHGWFYDVAQNSSYASSVAYAEMQWWIAKLIEKKDSQKFFFPDRFMTRAEVCSLLDLDQTNLFCNNDQIKRWEFAALLLRGFEEYSAPKSTKSNTKSSIKKAENSNALFSQLRTLFSFVKT